MKTITINLYSFSELLPEAKQKALNKYFDINVDCDWWHGTYDDAANIGLKITGFDLDRGNYINGDFTHSAEKTAKQILLDHGNGCKTYILSSFYLHEVKSIEDAHNKDEDDDKRSEDLQNAENEFRNNLLNEYHKMLKNEYEYLTSEQAIIETFEANDYTFEINGRMNNG